MRVADATKCVLILWLLLATSYWKSVQCVTSHKPWACILLVSFIDKKTTSNITEWYALNTSREYVCIDNKLYLAPPQQSPLIHKWNGMWSRCKRKTQKSHNKNLLDVCRMTYARSLEKSLDGVQDMEVTQTKKRTSTSTCVAIIDKTKNRSTNQEKTLPLWLGFKARNALNASKGLAKVSHKSVSELVKMGMYESEALECQDCIPAYPYVPQELWPNKNALGKQNYHHTQIPSDIEVSDGFAMDYHVALFFDLDEMVIPKEEALKHITKRLDIMKISLGEDISDPIAIMCTHGGKQWSGHAKLHLKIFKKMVLPFFKV